MNNEIFRSRYHGFLIAWVNMGRGFVFYIALVVPFLRRAECPGLDQVWR